MKTCIQVQQLDIGYRKGRHTHCVLRQIDLDLKAGEVTVLLGRNGAGKSTMMRTLAGAQPALAGSIHIQGLALSELSPRDLARKLAWVTPIRDIAAGLTGWDVVALGRQPYTPWHGRLATSDYQAIEKALITCQAENLALRSMAELSDGERQRLTLARALAQATDIILLDEPTAFLDRPGRQLVFKLARQWADQLGRCLLLSTHDLDLAQQYAHQTLLVTDGKAIMGHTNDLSFREMLDKAFEP